MKLGLEIYTTEVLACKAFYTRLFSFSVKFETEGFVILQHGQHADLLFCEPNSPFVHPVFHPPFSGKGAILQMEVKDVEAEHQRLIIEERLHEIVPLSCEDVNGYHFTIQDPSGLLVDIVQYQSP